MPKSEPKSYLTAEEQEIQRARLLVEREVDKAVLEIACAEKHSELAEHINTFKVVIQKMRNSKAPDLNRKIDEVITLLDSYVTARKTELSQEENKKINTALKDIKQSYHQLPLLVSYQGSHTRDRAFAELAQLYGSDLSEGFRAAASNVVSSSMMVLPASSFASPTDLANQLYADMRAMREAFGVNPLSATGAITKALTTLEQLYRWFAHWEEKATTAEQKSLIASVRQQLAIEQQLFDLSGCVDLINNSIVSSKEKFEVIEKNTEERIQSLRTAFNRERESTRKAALQQEMKRIDNELQAQKGVIAEERAFINAVGINLNTLKALRTQLMQAIIHPLAVDISYTWGLVYGDSTNQSLARSYFSYLSRSDDLLSKSLDVVLIQKLLALVCTKNEAAAEDVFSELTTLLATAGDEAKLQFANMLLGVRAQLAELTRTHTSSEAQAYLAFINTKVQTFNEIAAEVIPQASAVIETIVEDTSATDNSELQSGSPTTAVEETAHGESHISEEDLTSHSDDELAPALTDEVLAEGAQTLEAVTQAAAQREVEVTTTATSDITPQPTQVKVNVSEELVNKAIGFVASVFQADIINILAIEDAIKGFLPVLVAVDRQDLADTLEHALNQAVDMRDKAIAEAQAAPAAEIPPSIASSSTDPSVPPPPPAPPLPESVRNALPPEMSAGQQALLAEILQGKQLKKTVRDEVKTVSGNGDSLQAELMRRFHGGEKTKPEAQVSGASAIPPHIVQALTGTASTSGPAFSESLFVSLQTTLRASLADMQQKQAEMMSTAPDSVIGRTNAKNAELKNLVLPVKAKAAQREQYQQAREKLESDLETLKEEKRRQTVEFKQALTNPISELKAGCDVRFVDDISALDFATITCSAYVLTSDNIYYVDVNTKAAQLLKFQPSYGQQSTAAPMGVRAADMASRTGASSSTQVELSPIQRLTAYLQKQKQGDRTLTESEIKTISDATGHKHVNATLTSVDAQVLDLLSKNIIVPDTQTSLNRLQTWIGLIAQPQDLNLIVALEAYLRTPNAITARDGEGRNLLQLAVLANNLPALQYLLLRDDVTRNKLTAAVDAKGNTILHLAAQHQDGAIYRYLTTTPPPGLNLSAKNKRIATDGGEATQSAETAQQLRARLYNDVVVTTPSSSGPQKPSRVPSQSSTSLPPAPVARAGSTVAIQAISAADVTAALTQITAETLNTDKNYVTVEGFIRTVFNLGQATDQETGETLLHKLIEPQYPIGLLNALLAQSTKLPKLLNAKTTSGETALDVANRLERTDIAAALKKAGAKAAAELSAPALPASAGRRTPLPGQGSGSLKSALVSSPAASSVQEPGAPGGSVIGSGKVVPNPLDSKTPPVAPPKPAHLQQAPVGLPESPVVTSPATSSVSGPEPTAPATGPAPATPGGTGLGSGGLFGAKKASNPNLAPRKIAAKEAELGSTLQGQLRDGDLDAVKVSIEKLRLHPGDILVEAAGLKRGPHHFVAEGTGSAEQKRTLCVYLEEAGFPASFKNAKGQSAAEAHPSYASFVSPVSSDVTTSPSIDSVAVTPSASQTTLSNKGSSHFGAPAGRVSPPAVGTPATVDSSTVPSAEPKDPADLLTSPSSPSF